jgi:hypothetical protein
MSHARLLFAVSLVWSALAVAEEPHEDLPPLNEQQPVDSSPTAYSCTGETLVKGTRCSFDGEGGKATPAQNLGLIKTLAPEACTSAVKNDPGDRKSREMHKLCVKSFVDEAETNCDLEGARLVDGEGRFTRDGRGCYTRLAETLQRSTVRASVASSCCRCLADNGCPGSRGPVCIAELSRLQPKNEALACMTRVCSTVCGAAVPRELERPARKGAPPDRIDRQAPTKTTL